MRAEMVSVGQSLWSPQRLVPGAPNGNKVQNALELRGKWVYGRKDSIHKEVGRGSLSRDNSSDFWSCWQQEKWSAEGRNNGGLKA